MTARVESNVAFREIQQFGRGSMWFVVCVTSAGMMVAGLVIWLQVSAGAPSRPSFPGFFVLAISMMVILGVAVVMRSARLTTEVREDGLYIRFYPFHLSFRRIPLDNVKSFEVKTYNPLRDYGGQGIRYGIAGKAYTVSGNRGVKFTFRHGKDLLIGSQRADELVGSVEWLLQRHAGHPGSTRR